MRLLPLMLLAATAAFAVPSFAQQQPTQGGVPAKPPIPGGGPAGLPGTPIVPGTAPAYGAPLTGAQTMPLPGGQMPGGAPGAYGTPSMPQAIPGAATGNAAGFPPAVPPKPGVIPGAAGIPAPGANPALQPPAVGGVPPAMPTAGATPVAIEGAEVATEPKHEVGYDAKIKRDPYGKPLDEKGNPVRKQRSDSGLSGDSGFIKH